ncbi:MAG TPA: DinB family protein [Pyrinomonadaceae bacterium]|nr:DinB family protein [Pyrinomonadaceae bacterium]
MKLRSLLIVCCVLVVSGTSTGRVSGDHQTSTFMIKKVAGELKATPQAGNEMAAEMRRSWAEVSDWVTSAAETVPAEKYNYRPADTVRTFGQLIGHIADSYNYYCAQAAGQKVEWSDPIEKGSTDKGTVVPKLKLALEKCNSAYASEAGQVRPLIGNVAHTNLHYGNIITYMRMLGMKPPSS